MVIKTKRSSYGGSEFPTGGSGWGLAEQLDEIVRRHHLAAQISAAARPRPRSGLAMKGRAECYEVGEPLGDEPVAALCIHHDVGDQRSPEDRPEMAEHAVAHQRLEAKIRAVRCAGVACHTAWSTSGPDRVRTHFRSTVYRRCVDRRKECHRTSPTRPRPSRCWAGRNVWHHKAKLSSSEDQSG